MKDLLLHAYKIQLTQELKPTDHVQRREFNWVLENQKVVSQPVLGCLKSVAMQEF
jgi:hypothetical protein